MIRLILFIVVSAMVTGCAGARFKPLPAPAPPSDATSPSAGAAKTAPYEVFGQRYYPIVDAAGYRERGVASWYGGKFHGRHTANGERYDMYQYTAAHTTLPLPTWVRVTNLRNGATVTVRVNDRGPFVKNRLIDLSYAAALQLGMIGDGTTLVEIEAIATADADRSTSIQTALPVPLPALVSIPASNVAIPETAATAVAAAEDDGSSAAQTAAANHSAVIYVQVGAFGERGNAERLQSTLYNAGIAEVRLNSADLAGAPVHRVQIGPIAGVTEYDQLIAQLDSIGIRETHLVTE